MRCIQNTYTPVTAVTNGYGAGLTVTSGVAMLLTATAPTDGYGHSVTLSGNQTGANFAVVGLDADGNPQTETITGANGTTAGSKYFSKITSITPSATTGVAADVGWAAPSLTKAIPLERHSLTTATLEITVTGTINVTVSDTIGDVFKNYPVNCPWDAISALTSKTAQTRGNAVVNAAGVQLLTNSVTNGATVTLWISESTQVTG